MKQTITAKLKLQTDSTQFAALRQTQLAYRAALNHVSRYSFEHGKKSNQRALQQECYDETRLKFGLPAQMACNVARQVGATYKTSGPGPGTTPKLARPVAPRNVTRDWISLPSTSPPRSPTILIAITVLSQATR